MPTLGQVRDRVDDKLANVVWPLIVAKQDVYKNGVWTEEEVEDTDPESPTFGEMVTVRTYTVQPHGNYWQGLRTHAIEPAHVTAGYSDTTPTELGGSPSDQPVTWTSFIPEINVSLPAAFVIDVYHGPQGQGFVASVFARYNGTLYSRSQNSGPETWRTVGWHSVDELGV